MPGSEQAAMLTEGYRSRLRALVDSVQLPAVQEYAAVNLDDVRGSWGPVGDRVAQLVARAQTAGARLAAAYLGAFIQTELGRPHRVSVASGDYANKSLGGADLRPTLDTVRVTVLQAIGKGQADPLGSGRSTLKGLIDLDVKAASRAALSDLMATDANVDEWRRSVRGTCAACMGADSGNLPAGTPLNVHPNCECVAEPVVRGVTQSIIRATGAERFASLSPKEQDAAIGPDAAKLVRDGEAKLSDFIANPAPGFILQRPTQEVA